MTFEEYSKKHAADIARDAVMKAVLHARNADRIYDEYRAKATGKLETSLSPEEISAELARAEKRIEQAYAELDAEIVKAADAIRSNK
jgi:hypothetical protein